jgi:hypothetical protein
VIDPDDNSVITVGCVTNITGISASRDQLETTCLSSAARTFEAGLANPGTATFTVNFDPSDASHVRIHELYTEGADLQWALGWSDGTADPSGASTDGFNLPASRTWLQFDGFISDLPFDFALNASVSSNVSVQVSGFPVLTPKSA